MSFDFVKIFKEIDLHKNDLDINNFMTMVINHCHEMKPNKSWDLFKELDYTTELESLATHVIDTLGKEPSPFIEQGFWFGLSDNGYLYFAVSEQYIAEEDNLDWMSEGTTYYPEQGAFSSAILRSIEDLADELKIDFDDADSEDVDTIGGLMAQKLGRVPIAGSTITLKGWKITSERPVGRRRRISSVIIERSEDIENNE